ncbi:MAG: pre-peptidase C-terminal domain-containing protein [Planctomycetota bacterium]
MTVGDLHVAAATRTATQVVLTLDAPLAPGADPHAIRVYVDRDANPGGRFERVEGRWTVEGAKLAFSPRLPLPDDRELRVSLPALQGVGGSLSARGLAPVSFPGDGQALGEVRLGAEVAAGTQGVDDHGDAFADATALAQNQGLAGEVEVAGDRDWFRVDLRANVEVEVSVESADDTTLGVFDPGGARIAFNDDDPQGGLDSRLVLTPSRSGAYGLEVRAYGSGTASYQVRVTPVKAVTAATPAQPAADDHGDDAASGTAWSGAAIRGAIQAPGDVDVFLLDLSAGEATTVRTETTGDTTLRVLDPQGAQVAFNDDAPGGGRESRVSFRAPRAGTYAAVVAGYGDQQPSYTLVARAEPELSPEAFVARDRSDVWQIDFELRRDLFDADMDRHGLRSGDPETDRLVRRRMIALILSELGQKYGLDERGTPVVGRSLRVSFVSERPAGRVGRDYSREAVGGRHEDTTSTLGVSYLDPGNRRAEDNSRLGQLGIFTEVIYGSDSRLSPRLSAGDRRYLDGSYALGDGTASEDRRFRRVHDVTADWAHAISVVTAHEVGHSVGLNHDESDRRGIMQAALSRFVLSDRRTAFGAGSAQILEQNLGVH